MATSVGDSVYIEKFNKFGEVINRETRRDGKVEVHVELDNGQGKVSALESDVEVINEP